MMSRITIEKADDENVFAALREEWRGLFAAAAGVASAADGNGANLSPFLSWEWLSTWYKWFGEIRYKPFVLKAYAGENRLVGLLPLCREEKSIFGMRLRRLTLMGEKQGGADYLDLIAARPEDKTEILQAIIEFLKKENDFDWICLESVANDSTTAEWLRNIGRRCDGENQPLRLVAEKTAICPRIDLASGDWEAILKKSRRASNFKRRFKQLEKTPGFEFRTIVAPSEVGAAFERFYHLHERRWAADGGSELSGHPRLAAFQRDLISRLSATGLLRFDELWADGHCRASVYGLDDGRTFYYYNSGYDLEWASRSVGLVLIGLSVKHAIARGVRRYDFLRGDENYKFDWADGQTELVTMNLSRSTTPALAYEGITRARRAARDFSKYALPAGFAETLKNRLRARQRNQQLSNPKIESATAARQIYES